MGFYSSLEEGLEKLDILSYEELAKLSSLLKFFEKYQITWLRGILLSGGCITDKDVIKVPDKAGHITVYVCDRVSEKGLFLEVKHTEDGCVGGVSVPTDIENRLKALHDQLIIVVDGVGTVKVHRRRDSSKGTAFRQTPQPKEVIRRSPGKKDAEEVKKHHSGTNTLFSLGKNRAVFRKKRGWIKVSKTKFKHRTKGF